MPSASQTSAPLMGASGDVMMHMLVQPEVVSNGGLARVCRTSKPLCQLHHLVQEWAMQKNQTGSREET